MAECVSPWLRGIEAHSLERLKPRPAERQDLVDRQELLTRVVEVLRADVRIPAAWLGGSLGRCAGDE